MKLMGLEEYTPHANALGPAAPSMPIRCSWLGDVPNTEHRPVASLYANSLPWSVVSRPLGGDVPTIRPGRR
jgi:hypothetical protein